MSFLNWFMQGYLRMTGAQERHSVTGEEAVRTFENASKSPAQDPQVPYEKLREISSVHRISIGGQPCYRIKRKGQGFEKPSGNGAIFYLFGGGFLKSAKKRDFQLAAQLARETGREVWLLCYPLEPDHTIRQITKNVLLCYRAMLREYDASRIIFFGLSAGACLCIYLLNYLRHEGINVPLPARMILNSPVVQLPPTRNEYEMMKLLDDKDCVLSSDYFGPQGLISCMLRKEPEESLYLSRGMRSDMTGWPPLTVIFGDCETPYAYMEDFMRRCHRYHVDAEGIIVRGGGHCPILFAPAPEARQVRRRVVDIILAEQSGGHPH